MTRSTTYTVALLLAVAVAALLAAPAALAASAPDALQRGRAKTIADPDPSPRKRDGALPVVMWHGMGDSCCAAGSMGALKAAIEEELDGVFVHSIATGSGELQDVWSSFMGSVNDQVAAACKELKGMRELKGGFNAVGFSQGGQFLRAVVERCGHELPPIRTLVTLGGQHQGVMAAPGCSAAASPSGGGGGGSSSWTDKACGVMRALLARGAYAPWVREHVVQAQYFKDPSDLDAYLASNVFLPDINNERAGERNEQYAANVRALGRLVLYRFDRDSTVVPRDSSWFSFFDGAALVPLRDQPLYKDDYIGLRALDERGGLFLESAPGEHMQFTLEWFRNEIIARWLAPASDDDSAA